MAAQTIEYPEKGDVFKMGRKKLGNRNAQINNNKSVGKTSSELVKFTTGQDRLVRNRPNDD